MSEEKTKSTDIEIQRRVNACFTLMLSGYNPAEIFRFVSENEAKMANKAEFNPDYIWHVSERQVQNYCRKANELFAEQERPKILEAYNKSLMRLEVLYRKAIDSKRLDLALKVQQEINRISQIDKLTPDDAGSQQSGSSFTLPNGTKIQI